MIINKWSGDHNQNVLKKFIFFLQEVENLKKVMKEKMDKLTEKNDEIQKKLERTRIESECRLEEAAEDKDKLMKEIKRLQGHEEVGVS